MRCHGCYKASGDDYCMVCRKRLFDGIKIPKTLPFDAPKDSNLVSFQEQTKRLSISGVQLKYSLRLEGKELVLAEKNGHYILKPIPPTAYISEAAQAPENEHLTMQIAEQVFKIKTAYNAIIYFKDGTPAYITRRFDTKQNGTKYLQEDMAQLSGRSRVTEGGNFKYNGTIEEIGKLIRKYVAAADPALETLFRVVLFNYLLSNGDAHLKNFSLLQTEPGEYGLTPAYDLMSTILHMPNESDTALDLYEGDTKGPTYSKYGFLGQSEFRNLADKLGLVSKRNERILNEMLLKQHQVINMTQRSFLSEKMRTKYLQNFQDKLHRLGMTAEMIRRSINPESPGVYEPTTRTLEISFLGGPKMVGNFEITELSKTLEKENKFTFIEAKNANKYNVSRDPKLITIIDANSLIDVQLLIGQ